ncbi:MAG: Glycosyl transferase, group 1 [uncultured Sulfurovum sp.]|uniref:Glycosyl transferase, group 1 n=1 Tax=uncultured Sulfurovum sp. TaxID=269237 RepID=A0A6S6TWC0_9BACT|nr:MAG: Glycosyl transferase, group 1 [uncultured Sulfurovum sp.]
MKILFLTDNFPPEVNAPATRTYEHCKYWVTLGYEVIVLTCNPNFPHGKTYAGYKNKLYQEEFIDGVKVIRVWSYMTENKGFTKRILDYSSYALMAFFVGIFQKFDLIIATSPQFFTTWSAWGISKIKSKPWIFELRDIWPESLKTVGAMKHEKVLRFLEKIELGLYRDAEHVIVVTNAFKKNLISRGINKDKISVITNGANNKLFNIRPKDEYLLMELKLNNKFIVGYIGTHGMAHSLDFIVKSIAKVVDKEIHFLFIGDGAIKKEIVTLTNKLALENVTFLNPVVKEEVPRYLSICDVSLAPLKNRDNFKEVIPSKIFEASAMGKPTLLGVRGEAQNLLEKYNAGMCFLPEDTDDFLLKLTALKEKKNYLACQQGCVKLANDYDRGSLAKKMLVIIDKVVDYTLSTKKVKTSIN